ncbi:uncharacterized protein haspin isoform X1 [Anguilla rostrata]|uniref:uncharacterized protein haspin isoform X1 n=1 Tax=Anguilla rostrata TaxID=7938 RepID=UPI0030CB69C2
MNRFGRNEPLVLKTYGKHSRKVERWISPDTRKTAFASTSSSDLSIGESSGLRFIRRNKKVSTASSRPVRAAKKKALNGLRESDSDAENFLDPTPEQKLGASRKRRGTLSVKALPKWKRRVSESTSESEEEKTSKSRATSCGSGAMGSGLKAGNSAALPSYLSRFVTHRRRGAPEKPRVTQPSRTAQKPRVSVGDGSWNSSEDFLKSLTLAQRSRKVRPVPRRALPSANSSAELVSPAPGLCGARVVLKAVSLNGSADDRPPASGYKKPLLSSTPSVSARPGYRHLEPSVSEISCSMDDAEEAFRPGEDATGSLASPGQQELRVLLESSEENEGGRVGLPVSNGNAGVPQHSAELFSRVGCEAGVRDGPGTVRDLPSSENLSVQFLSAETHLGSLAASLKGRGTPVVVLERADLSDYLSGGRGEREEEDEDAYSSCLDSESALRGSGSEDKLGSSAEVPGGSGSAGAGHGDGGLGEDAGRGAEDEERRGAGLRSGEWEESASVVWIPPSPLGESGGGRLGDAERGAFGAAHGSSPAPNAGDGVPVAEQSRDLFLDRSEVEPEDGSGEAPPAAASRKKASLSPEEEEDAGNSRPLAAVSVRASLEKRCRLVQPTVLLRPLDLSQWIVGHGTLPARGSFSAREREARSSGSGPQSSPVSSDPQGRPQSSPERPGRANPGRDGGRPSVGPRRRLSSTSAFASGAAKSASVSASFALSPGQKRGPGRARNQGAPPPRDKPGTGRKACVSGLSVSRWAKNDLHRQRPKKGPAQSHLSRAGDCSLFDFQLGPNTKKQPDGGSSLLKDAGSSLLKDGGSSLFQGPSGVVLGTPRRVEPLNISSLLADFTPEALTTHTWSRLKAALSVHKRKKAFFTPQKLSLSQAELHGDGSLDGSARLLYSPQCTPLSRHLKASLLRSATATPLGASLLSEDITDAEKLYLECQQEGPILFEQCIPPHRMKLCKKVGEGTFGEVFTTTNDSNETVALKIVPIEGKQKVNGEDQKSFGEILHEVIISKELSSLDAKEMNKTNGFIGLNNLHCVRGAYPKLLLSAWDKFDKQRRSENDRPDFFEEDQLFLILEFEFGGSDLEAMNGKLSSLVVAKSILHQVTAALAVAEQALCFEHRDLHWGNILVKTTKEKTGTYVLNGTSHSVETKGVHVNIIDYSLSRLEIDGLTVSCDISADEALFMGKGDYQFDIYRKMREENKNSWSEFNPHTNVLWIHYLADKLLQMSFRSKAQTKPMRELKRSIAEFHRSVLAYGSAASVLESCSLFQEA